MEISNVIYRLSKLSRLLDIEGCEKDSEALSIAAGILGEQLKDGQAKNSCKYKSHQVDGRHGNSGAGLLEKIKSRI